jgi:hypothetical protein
MRSPPNPQIRTFSKFEERVYILCHHTFMPSICKYAHKKDVPQADIFLEYMIHTVLHTDGIIWRFDAHPQKRNSEKMRS